MTRKTTILGTVAAAALAVTPMTAAFAQDTGTTMQDNGAMDAAPMAFSDAQLESFAEAVTKVLAVRQDYQAQIAEVTDPDQQQALIEEAQTEMMTAVENTDGITVETYNDIGMAARSDQELNDQIIALIEAQAMPEGG